jgi:Ala-tRNA(Pro) deacylase
MLTGKLKEFLDTNSIKYVIITHSPAFTANEIAQTSHIPGKELAKTVMVKIDGRMAMVVAPASCKVDFVLLKKATGAESVVLASEAEFRDMFPECEIGAMPPFGNIYGMDVFVANDLVGDEEIAFNAGSHIELVKMAYKDFEALVHPKVIKCSVVH